jgi:alpha-beta hydrolase superfamily lysophospholipase
MNRFVLLLAAALLVPACATPAAISAPAAAPAARAISLPAANGRQVPLTVWQASHPRGVILFGHGLGGQPATYRGLIDRWVAQGYSVVAPLSVDSRAHPDRAKYDMPAGFAARVEDLTIARAFIARTFPGQRVALAGHSYGSLFALIGAGASTPAGQVQGPPVAAVLAFSSPGAIPQLINSRTYATLSAPLLMVTGDKDIVPGFVPDAAAHRLPFDTAPAGDKLLVTVRGGGHDLASTADPATAAAIADLGLAFLDTHLAGDRIARRRLGRMTTTSLFTLERR